MPRAKKQIQSVHFGDTWVGGTQGPGASVGDTLRKRSNLLGKGAGPGQQDGVKRTPPSASISWPLDTQTFSSWKPGASPGAVARGDITGSSPPARSPAGAGSRVGTEWREHASLGSECLPEPPGYAKQETGTRGLCAMHADLK